MLVELPGDVGGKEEGLIVIRSRQHLAALRPQGQPLVLELLRFSDELVDATASKVPGEAGGHRKEMDLAKSLKGFGTRPKSKRKATSQKQAA